MSKPDRSRRADTSTQTHARLVPSPGTPGEGLGEGLRIAECRFRIADWKYKRRVRLPSIRNPQSAIRNVPDPHPRPLAGSRSFRSRLPEYRARKDGPGAGRTASPGSIVFRMTETRPAF